MDKLQPLHKKLVYTMGCLALISLSLSIYFVFVKGDSGDLISSGVIFLSLLIGSIKMAQVYWRGQILYWSINGIVEIAALLLVGLWPTLLAVICHSWIQDLLHTPKELRTRAWVIKSVGGNSLMVLGAGATFKLLGGEVGQLELPTHLPAVIGMILAFTLFNNLFVFLLGFAAIHPRPWQEFKSHLRHSPLYLTFTGLEGVIGVLFVFVYLYQPWLLVFLTLYPVLLFWSFKQTSTLQMTTDAALEGFANLVDQRNESRVSHSERVAKLTLEIGQTMGLTSTELDQLHWTSRLHDLGAVAIDPSLIEKADPLTDDEKQIIRAHAATSASILSAFGFSEKASEIVQCHHERPDGKGYYNYPANQIPLASLIIAVADAFDAMTSARPYREALGKEHAYQQLLAGRGSQFDSDVVDAFLYSQDPQRFPDYQSKLPARPGDEGWANSKRNFLNEQAEG